MLTSSRHRPTNSVQSALVRSLTSIVIDDVDLLMAPGITVTLHAVVESTADSVTAAAARATIQSTDPYEIALREFTHGARPKYQPFGHIRPGGLSISGNIWHHGRQYEIALKGDPQDLLIYCDTTEGEREALLIEYAQLCSQYHRVQLLACASRTSALTRLADIKHQSLQVIGFITYTRRLAPGIKKLFSQLHTVHIAVQLVSSLPAPTLIHIAHSAGLIHSAHDVLDCRQLPYIGNAQFDALITPATMFAATFTTSAVLSRLKRQSIVGLITNRPSNTEHEAHAVFSIGTDETSALPALLESILAHYK